MPRETDAVFWQGPMYLQVFPNQITGWDQISRISARFFAAGLSLWEFQNHIYMYIYMKHSTKWLIQNVYLLICYSSSTSPFQNYKDIAPRHHPKKPPKKHRFFVCQSFFWRFPTQPRYIHNKLKKMLRQGDRNKTVSMEAGCFLFFWKPWRSVTEGGQRVGRLPQGWSAV